MRLGHEGAVSGLFDQRYLKLDTSNDPTTGTFTHNGAAIFNELGNDHDLRVEGQTEVNLFYVNAGNDRVGVGVALPQATLHVVAPSNSQIRIESSGASNADISVRNTVGFWGLRVNAGGSFFIFDRAAFVFPFIIRVGTLCSAFVMDSDETILNEDALDLNFRVEGETLSHMFLVDASSATENIALLTTDIPEWQSMDRGIFIGDSSTAPTGDPSNGGFLYVESGALKYRGSSGTVTTLGSA